MEAAPTIGLVDRQRPNQRLGLEGNERREMDIRRTRTAEGYMSLIVLVAVQLLFGGGRWWWETERDTTPLLG